MLEQNKKKKKKLRLEGEVKGRRREKENVKKKTLRAHDAEEIYHRQYEALVVVGVLADEINASRRVHANGGLLAEFLGEGRQRPRFNAINVGELCRHVEIRSGLRDAPVSETKCTSSNGGNGGR